METLRRHSAHMGDVSEGLRYVRNEWRIYLDKKCWDLRGVSKYHMLGDLSINIGEVSDNDDEGFSGFISCTPFVSRKRWIKVVT